MRIWFTHDIDDGLMAITPTILLRRWRDYYSIGFWWGPIVLQLERKFRRKKS